jgi:hypothetical protein
VSGKTNTGIPPLNDNDWTFNLGEPFHLLDPIIAGLDVTEIRTRSAPGAGAVQLFTDGAAASRHSIARSARISGVALPWAPRSDRSPARLRARAPRLCVVLALATFGLGAALCLLIVAAAILAGAALGGIIGDAIGGVAGWDRRRDHCRRRFHRPSTWATVRPSAPIL